MADYIINFTDPLTELGTFTIKPYTADGNKFPTSSTLADSSTAHSSVLLLYGKGHPDYGERTDENLLHLAENFSGASKPIIEIAGNTTKGVLWNREVLYWRNTSTNLWYQYADGAWSSSFSVPSGVLSSRPLTPGDGALYYATDTQQLFRYYGSTDPRELNQWLEREFDSGAGSHPTNPTRELWINHDGSADDDHLTPYVGWHIIQTTSTCNLYVLKTGDIMSGNLTISKSNPTLDLTGINPKLDFDDGEDFELGSYFIINGSTNVLTHVKEPATTYAADVLIDSDIPNKKYVDDAVAAASPTGPLDRYVLTGIVTSGGLVVALPFSYTIGEYRLMVFQNGVKLYAGYGYTESGTTQITLTTTVIASDILEFLVIA